MNRAVLIGRLAQAVEFKYTSSGTPVARFNLAVNRNFKDKNGEKGTDFIPVVVWGKSAENCKKYLEKGRQVAVSGRIQTRSYEVEGQKRYVTEIVADEVEFLGSRNSDTGSGQEVLSDFTEIDEDEPF